MIDPAILLVEACRALLTPFDGRRSASLLAVELPVDVGAFRLDDFPLFQTDDVAIPETGHVSIAGYTIFPLPPWRPENRLHQLYVLLKAAVLLP